MRRRRCRSTTLFWVFVALQCLTAAAVAPSLRTSLVGTGELVWPSDAAAPDRTESAHRDALHE